MNIHYGTRAWLPCLAAAALCLGAQAAFAQGYPSKPIRMLVPFPPGGPADILGRVISQKMGEGFGQPLLIDNRPGANTIIAAQLVAKAPPDGYTLLMAIDSTLSMNQTLYAKLPYDPLKDFEPVSLIAIVPTMLVVHPSVPANNVRELIEFVKSKSGKVMYGSGTFATQLAAELFNSMAGVKMGFVPYKGASLSIVAVMSGEVPVSFNGVSAALEAWRGGKVKAIAVLGAKRLPQAPDVPTVAESGLPGFEAQVWQSVVAPAGTPRDVIAKLNAELTRIMQLPETHERLSAAGLVPNWSTPAELAAYIRSEAAKWGKVIRELGLKLE
jgi:tripartite-type tricarboxylate transporter receptor subunit TctC